MPQTMKGFHTTTPWKVPVMVTNVFHVGKLNGHFSGIILLPLSAAINKLKLLHLPLSPLAFWISFPALLLTLPAASSQVPCGNPSSSIKRQNLTLALLFLHSQMISLIPIHLSITLFWWLPTYLLDPAFCFELQICIFKYLSNIVSLMSQGYHMDQACPKGNSPPSSKSAQPSSPAPTSCIGWQHDPLKCSM